MINKKRIVIVVSGLTVIVAAFINKTAVPLYDGVGFPDEPYRYADLTHKPKTKPPSAPSLVFMKSDAQHGISLQSSEVGPQVVVYISPSSISLSQGVTEAKLVARPVKPKTQPNDGTIAGNVYRITGSAQNGTFDIIRPGTNSYNYINMRLPQGFKPNPAMEFRPLGSGGWRLIDSTRIGTDIYESTGINSFGDYALVKLNKIPASKINGVKHHNTASFAAAGFAALVSIMASVILLIRRDQKQKIKKT